MARTAPVPNIPPIPGMCPSIAVMGGGGDGGGGGGRGGKNGNGNGNANGDGSGDDADGDGRGNGACGPGSPGSCTNCGNNVSAGDPVDVSSGAVLVSPRIDLFLPGPFSLEVMRRYSSDWRDRRTSLGHGWIHSLAWRLEEKRENAILWTGDGKRVVIPKVQRPGESWTGAGWGVRKVDGLYCIRPGNEFIHWFKESELGDGRWDLYAITYRQRGTVLLEHDKGALVRVTDAVGRVIHFDNDERRRLTSIRVPSPSQKEIVFARYHYDAADNLVGHVDADGHHTAYTYDEHHRMTRVEYPNKLTAHFRYDASGRCKETWCDENGGPVRGLADDVTQVLADGTTRAKGVLHCVLDYHDDGYSEVVDSRGVRRFFAGEDGKIGKAVDARGGVMTRTMDDLGRVTSQTDANGARSHFEYGAVGEWTKQVDADGATITMERDAAGRPVRIVDPAGGVVELILDATGEVSSMTDQNGSVSRFERDAQGQPTACTDDLGGRRRWEYDAHGNAVRFVTATGGVCELTFDWWGRVTSERDPAGNRRALTYSDGGKILSIHDALGHTTTYAYDGMGKLVRQQNPDGTVITAEYCGLGWLWQTHMQNGTRVAVAYDREGWPVRVWNEKDEVYEIERGPTGLIEAEKDFIGRTTRYGHDLVGRVTWRDEGDGKYVIERDVMGRIVGEESPDGSTRTFQYDVRGELVRTKSGATGFAWRRDATGEIVGEELFIGETRYAISKVRGPTGRVDEVKTSLGHHLSFARNAAGQVTKVSTPDDAVMTIARDAIGAPVQRALAGAGAIFTSWDEGRRAKTREIASPAVASSAVAQTPPAANARRYAYEYTPVDEVRSVWLPGNESLEFDYDVRRHVTAVKRNGIVTELFGTDAAENYFETAPGAPTRRYGLGGRIEARGDIEYEHDALGRMTARRRILPDGKWTDETRFTYDGFGLLSAVDNPDGTRLEFRYDAFARRLDKRVIKNRKVIAHTHYVWDLTSIVHEVDVLAKNDAPPLRTFAFEDEGQLEPIAERVGGDEEWRYYLTDVNGAPMELVDGAGKLLARFDRTVFGSLTERGAGTPRTPLRFSGQWADDETGLHYNRYRYYDPILGRYLTPDPIYLDGGLNFYAYGPNPVAWVDPMAWDTHFATVTGMDPAHARHSASGVGNSPVLYDSGRTAPVCPQALSNANTMLSHSEQTFCYDVMRSGVRGGNYRLGGTRPPCPNCHGAMMRTAAETGSTIQYEWGPPPNNTGNSITYTPTGVPPGNYVGTAAEGLRDGRRPDGSSSGAYSGITLDPNWNRPPIGPSGPAVGNPSTFWGVNQPPGTTSTYRSWS